jgi:hypothetical protein
MPTRYAGILQASSRCTQAIQLGIVMVIGIFQHMPFVAYPLLKAAHAIPVQDNASHTVNLLNERYLARHRLIECGSNLLLMFGPCQLMHIALHNIDDPQDSG